MLLRSIGFYCALEKDKKPQLRLNSARNTHEIDFSTSYSNYIKEMEVR